MSSEKEKRSLMMIVFGIVVVSLVANMVASTTDESCKRAALDSLCYTYGYSSGGAIDVLYGSGNYTVLCDDSIHAANGKDAYMVFEKVLMNTSAVW